jgi:hypothetical protein
VLEQCVADLQQRMEPAAARQPDRRPGGVPVPEHNSGGHLPAPRMAESGAGVLLPRHGVLRTALRERHAMGPVIVAAAAAWPR